MLRLLQSDDGTRPNHCPISGKTQTWKIEQSHWAYVPRPTELRFAVEVRCASVRTVSFASPNATHTHCFQTPSIEHLASPRSPSLGAWSARGLSLTPSFPACTSPPSRHPCPTPIPIPIPIPSTGKGSRRSTRQLSPDWNGPDPEAQSAQALSPTERSVCRYLCLYPNLDLVLGFLLKLFWSLMMEWSDFV